MPSPAGYKYFIDVSFSTVSDLTDTIFFIDLSEMPSDFWNHLEKGDGSDIKPMLTDGVTALDREIVQFDDVAEEGNLWIRADASASGTTIRIFYGNASGAETNASTTWTDAGRVLAYHLDEGSGTSVADSANSNDGTGVGWVANKFKSGVCRGDELEFSGSDALRANDDATIDFGSEDVSVSMWIKANGSGFESLLHKSGSCANASDAGYSLLLRNSNPYLIYSVSNGTSELRTAGTVSDPRDNAYHMLVGTFDWSTKTVAIYDDGSLGNSNQNLSFSGSLTNNDDLHIGEDYNNGSPIARYAGRFDEVRIYDYAVTQNEITHLYDNQDCAGSYYTPGQEQKARVFDLMPFLCRSY